MSCYFPFSSRRSLEKSRRDTPFAQKRKGKKVSPRHQISGAAAPRPRMAARRVLFRGINAASYIGFLYKCLVIWKGNSWVVGGESFEATGSLGRLKRPGKSSLECVLLWSRKLLRVYQFTIILVVLGIFYLVRLLLLLLFWLFSVLLLLLPSLSLCCYFICKYHYQCH